MGYGAYPARGCGIHPAGRRDGRHAFGPRGRHLPMGDAVPARIDEIEGSSPATGYGSSVWWMSGPSRRGRLGLGFGVMLRGSGVPWDLRRAAARDLPGARRDPRRHERRLLRPLLNAGRGVRQSTSIIVQCLNLLEPGPVRVDDKKVTPPSRDEMKGDWSR